MNSRHFSKFICSRLNNYRSISTQNDAIARTEQLYSCFQKDRIENLRSLKFVPKKMAPKILARIYHDPSEQMKISKRIVGLQNHKLESDPEILTSRLKNLMQVSQSSLMNFSTPRLVKIRNGKNASKHNIELSASSSRSSFVQKPNGFLQKIILSHSDFQSKRYASTETLQLLNPNFSNSKVNHKEKKHLTSSRKRKDNQSLLLKANKESLTLVKDKNGTISKNADSPSELLLNIRDRLESLSISFNNNLMKIDSSLKDKINVMKAKFSKAAVAADETSQTEKISLSQYTDDKPLYKTNLQLMPMKAKTSFLAEINKYTKSLDFDPKKSVVARLPSYSPKVRLSRDFTSVDSPDNGREYVHQFLEPFKISGLMEKPDKCLSNMRSQILEITLKNSADADGVYLVSKKMDKTHNSV